MPFHLKAFNNSPSKPIHGQAFLSAGVDWRPQVVTHSHLHESLRKIMAVVGPWNLAAKVCEPHILQCTHRLHVCSTAGCPQSGGLVEISRRANFCRTGG